MNKKIKVLSLFDGISCARVALDRLGYDVEYYASEVDKYAIQIAQKNWPDTVQLGGVEEVGGLFKQLQYCKNKMCEVVDIDLLIGGSPCQDLSIAKANRKGLDGERSGLFWEYVRILKEVKLKYFVLENVASMPKEAKQLITETLGVEPIMIDAALVSAQRRKRLFWTNIPNVTQPEDRGIFLKDILEEIPVPPQGLEIKQKSKTLRLGGGGSKVGDKHEWDSVYQYRRTYWRETKGGKVPTLTANMSGTVCISTAVPTGERQKVEKYQHLPQTWERGGNNVPYILQTPRGKNNGGKKFDKVPTLTSGGSWEHNNKLNGIRKLTPTECERLQCLPDNYTDGVSNTQRYKALGNAFNVEVVKHILSFMEI